MQQLLGKIAALDPEASQGLRVIACFDELVIGNVNTRALLSAAASLAGCAAGLDSPDRRIAVDPRGELTEPTGRQASARMDAGADLEVWLDRDGAPQANDAIILERLALAVRVRHSRDGHRPDHRRELAIVLDPATSPEPRRLAAVRLGLSLTSTYRVLAAPLFSVWTTHPAGPEDVIATPLGHIHALVVHEAANGADATPLGIGCAEPVDRLPHAFRTALVALRMCDPPDEPVVRADNYGAIIALLADAPDTPDAPDVVVLDELMRHGWAAATLDALIRAGSLRQAARDIGVHHSTLRSRVDTIAEHVGYDPTDGFGRSRLGVAYLMWRIRRSRVLDLPPPS